MTNARVVKLDDVADLTGGFAFKSEQYVEHGRFVLRTVNIQDDASISREGAVFISESDVSDYERFALQEHDTLFVMVAATLGKIGYVRKRDLPALLNQNMWVIRAKQGRIDPLYLHYQFREISKIPLAWVSGSARSFLRRDDVRNLEFLLPEPRVQYQIGELLKALDDKIELNRRMNETLEAMARAIFKDWFVDFGPTRTKMAMRGEDPGKENVARALYLAPDLWALFPDRLDPDGIPGGWRESTIGQEVQVLGGSTPSTSDPSFWNGDISWATPKDLSNLKSPVLLSTERRITQKGLGQISSGILPSGTVLMSSRAPIGYLAVSNMPVAVNQGFIAMVCDKGLSNAFVWQWTQTNMDLVHAKANGSTFMEISKGNFKPIPIVVPSSEVLDAYDGMVGPLLAKIVANELESQTLAQTRDLLLPKLMSGEIRIKDAERELREPVE